MWINPRSAEVVDGGRKKRPRAQFYDSGPRTISETVASNTEPIRRRRRRDEASQTTSFYSTKSVTDVIVIDDSEISEAASAVDVLMNPIGMDDGAPGLVLPKSMKFDMGCRADFGNAPCDNVQNDGREIRKYDQIHVRNKFLRSSIACVQLFLGEVTILPVEGLHYRIPTSCETRLYERSSACKIAVQALTLVGSVYLTGVQGACWSMWLNCVQFRSPLFWLLVTIWRSVSNFLFKRLFPTLSTYNVRRSHWLIGFASQQVAFRQAVPCGTSA